MVTDYSKRRVYFNVPLVLFPNIDRVVHERPAGTLPLAALETRHIDRRARQWRSCGPDGDPKKSLSHKPRQSLAGIVG